MHKLKITKFWIVAFSVIIWNTFRNRDWNMVYVDFDAGTKKNGLPRRTQLIAKRTAVGFSVVWQDLDKMFGE